MKQAKLRSLQNPSYVNGDNMKDVTRISNKVRRSFDVETDMLMEVNRDCWH